MPSNERNGELTKSGTKQNSDVIGSGPQLEVPKSNSVFDFLYHDARRIASFLAQFETYGVLQQVRATESVEETESTKHGLTTGLSAAIAKTGTAQELTTGTESKDVAERTYDPLWTNARTLLSYLAERDMIVRDLSEARIDTFVLVTGTLAAFDLGLLKEAWKLPAVKDQVMKGALAQAKPADATTGNRRERQRARYEQQRSTSSDTEMAFEMMKIMPHTIQATIRKDDATVWASLREDSLVIAGSELLLKHGVGIAGVWSMLGVLDAFPHEAESSIEGYALDQMLAAISLGAIGGQVVGHLAPAVRLMLGRPGTAYGMTPLLIFREVSG